MSELPKRRWYQFSLRALMVVVTLFCVLFGAGLWVSDQVEIVRERRDMLSKCRVGYGDLEGPWRAGSKGGIPWFRRLLGDREVNAILLLNSTPSEEVERYRKLFPEAEVTLWGFLR